MEEVVILVPAYEPDDKLVSLVQNLRSLSLRVVVVDDGSTCDEAAVIFESIRDLVEVLLVHDVNCGKGIALRTGIAWIRDNMPRVRTIVTADSDGQHTPADIMRVAEASRKQADGLVIGVRHFVGNVPFRSRLGNGWARLFFRMLTGLSIADTQTGLRAIPRNLFDRMLELKGDRYEYETRMLVDARNHASPPVQVPIETVYIEGNKSSHYRPLKDTYLTLRALLSERFG